MASLLGFLQPIVSKIKKSSYHLFLLHHWLNRDLQPTLPNKRWSVTTGSKVCERASPPLNPKTAFVTESNVIYISTLKLIRTCCYTWYLTQPSSPLTKWTTFSCDPEVGHTNGNCLTALFWTHSATSLWSSQSDFLEFCSFIKYVM